MKKSINLLLAVIISFTALFAILPYNRLQTAKADENTYESLYYVSSSALSSGYYNNVILPVAMQYNIPPENAHLRYYQSNFFKNAVNYLTSENPSDSLIIFEMRQKFPTSPFYNYQTIREMTIETEIPQEQRKYLSLLELFGNLKQRGCKIMFVCESDEAYFADHTFEQNDAMNLNRFLDYVDIFVDLDTFYLFIENVLLDAMDACYPDLATGNVNKRQLHDCIFLIDDSFNIQNSIDLNDNTLYTQWLRLFIMVAYNIYYTNYNYNETLLNQAVLNTMLSYNIYFMFYNGIEYQCFPQNGNPDSLLQNENYAVYAIGSNKKGNLYADAWLNSVAQLRVNLERDFDIYFYKYASMDLSEYNFEIKYAGDELLIFDNSSPCSVNVNGNEEPVVVMEDILTSFIGGEDLSSYDNWVSRCDVTFMPYLPGEGWMRVLPFFMCEYIY